MTPPQPLTARQAPLKANHTAPHIGLRREEPQPPRGRQPSNAGHTSANLDRLAELLLPTLLEALQAPRAPRLVDAAELAAILHVSRDYVYDHAGELGGERL